MKIKYYLSLLLLLMFVTKAAEAQSTWDEVYTILKTNCGTANCHTGVENPAGKLYFDLEKEFVHLQILNQQPQNETAKANNNRLIYEGDPYRSYIFRKLNNGFAEDVPLEAGEQDDFHNIEISEIDKEMVRQWILYGAPTEGEVVKKTTIEEYYNGNGIKSVTEKPAAPQNGFQIHVGPYFLPAGAEQEYFYKYPLDNIFDKYEVTAFETFMGQSSHHFIIMKFWNSFVAQTKAGLRIWDRHDHATFEEVAQQNQRIELPQGSAFEWRTNTVLDLNTHYINFSSNSTLACDVYVNVETQAAGTAKQLMFTQLIPDTTIYIPNNGERIEVIDTFKSPVPIPKIYLWSLTSHAHKTSIDYDIYQPIPGQASNHIYDASCPGGVPGCNNTLYEYERPPTRYFDPFLETAPANGVIHKATYINNGSKPLTWNWTSEGEMMVFVMRYLFDTTGVKIVNNPIIEVADFIQPAINVWPNPATNKIYIDMPAVSNENLTFYLTDISGRTYKQQSILSKKNVLDIEYLRSGVYLLIIVNDTEEKKYHQKIVKQ